MTIAINTSNRFNTYAPGINDLVWRVVQELSQEHQDYHFLVISDREAITRPALPNVKIVPAGSVAKTPLLWQYWYNYKLPALLRKHKAAVFIGTEGLVSLRSRLPQIALVQSAAFLQHPSFLKKTHWQFYKKNWKASLHKATRLISFSEADKTILQDQYEVPADKITVAGYPIDPAFKPLAEHARDAVKEKYAEGHEYFLFAGKADDNHHIIELLKAFSFFKKRQKSSMRLLLLADEVPAPFRQQLASYKFRREVMLPEQLSLAEKAAIVAAAHSFVYPAVFMDDCHYYPLAALQCGVPVIAADSPFFRESWGGTMLYTNPASEADIAQKMMWLYKDEGQHKEIAAAGRRWAAANNSGRFSALLRDNIQALIS